MENARTMVDEDRFISSMSGCLGDAVLQKGEKLGNIAQQYGRAAMMMLIIDMACGDGRVRVDV